MGGIEIIKMRGEKFTKKIVKMDILSGKGIVVYPEVIAEFLVDIDISIPWHISAYYPQYKSELPATGIGIIEDTIEIGKGAGLKYVYGGNIRDSRYENTICSGCGDTIIERAGFKIISNNLKNGKCSKCGEIIDGIFQN